MPPAFPDLSGLSDLQFAYVLCIIIRNLRFVCIAFIVFLNEEYLIALVDFIVALRRTRGQRRWTLRESLSSILWTLTPHPGDPLRRGILAAAVYRDIGS